MSRFDLQGGVGIMGFISPMDTQDTYAVIDPIYGIDGLRNVATINDLDDITEERRRSGMIVGVEDGSTYYKLNPSPWTYTLSDWSEISFANIIFVDKEIPSGLVNGINTVFTLSNIPIINSEHIYLNGLLQESGVTNDYTISGNTITFVLPPLPNMKIICSYRRN